MPSRLSFRYVLLAFLPVLVLAKYVDARTEVIHWPAIKPLQLSIHITDPDKAAVKRYIRSAAGKPLYLLECHSGEYEDSSKFNYSGLFDCFLTSPGPPRDNRDLLHEDIFMEKDWWSRGRFLVEDMLGACAGYPEHGSVRHFQMRGMQLTLKLSHVQLTPAGENQGLPAAVLSFDFEVEVKPDPSAISAVAETNPFHSPPDIGTSEGQQSCTEIVRQHVPGLVTPEYLESNGLRGPYPKVRPVEKTFHIRTMGSYFEYSQSSGQMNQDHLAFPIQDHTGEPVYEFKCSQYPGGWFTYFVSDCGLFQTGKKFNHLEDAVDPYSRLGQNVFFPDQLFKECGTYPDWGARRKFKLRGLDLTLEFKDVVFHKGYKLDDDFVTVSGLKQATLIIKVQPDPSSTSPVAKPSKYAFRGFDPEGREACKKPLTILP